MATQYRPPSPSHSTAKPVHAGRALEHGVLGLLALAAAIGIYRVTFQVSEDVLMSLMAPVVVFLSATSLFSGLFSDAHKRRK
jgi:hypothetical protein